MSIGSDYIVSCKARELHAFPLCVARMRSVSYPESPTAPSPFARLAPFTPPCKGGVCLCAGMNIQGIPLPEETLMLAPVQAPADKGQILCKREHRRDRTPKGVCTLPHKVREHHHPARLSCHALDGDRPSTKSPLQMRETPAAMLARSSLYGFCCL